MRNILAACCILFTGVSAQAGLYYSGEKYASLPAQWRGFLLDHRTLRNIGVKPKNDADASPLRVRYLAEAKALQAKLDKGKLDADEIADLGALYIRLGEFERAVEILRPAQRRHANHFAIAANLGTAWHMLGDYRQAAASLEEAVRLAPGKHLAVEQAHLKLVRGRQREKSGELDDLFGVRYLNDKGDYEPGKFAAEQKKKLPSKAVEITQQLALMFPVDGPLLWQLAELANAHGDFPNAAAMMEGCIAQFGMTNPTLRKHRHILRDAVDGLPVAKVGAEHENKHAGTIAFRSRRPLISQSLAGALPPIDPKGINAVPWELFGETAIEKPFKVSFPKYLKELDGKQVALTGFMYPLGEDPDMAAFLFIEAPVGCWYCEMPETTGIIHVELPAGKTARYQRGLVRIVGRLSLNADDAEDFLYAVKDAKVGRWIEGGRPAVEALEEAVEFEWDADKAKANLRKHKIDFEEAATVFGDFCREHSQTPTIRRTKIASSPSGPRIAAVSLSFPIPIVKTVIASSVPERQHLAKGRLMKKKPRHTNGDDLREEYDASLIRSGVRGKYAQRYNEGTNLVLLAPDVAVAFPDARSVNAALRMLMSVAKQSASSQKGKN